MNSFRKFLDFPIENGPDSYGKTPSPARKKSHPELPNIMSTTEPFKRPAPPSYAPRVVGFTVTDATSVHRHPDNTFSGEEQVKRLQLEMQHDTRITVCLSQADALKLASQLEPATFVALITLTAEFSEIWLKNDKVMDQEISSLHEKQRDALWVIHEIVKRLSASIPTT